MYSLLFIKRIFFGCIGNFSCLIVQVMNGLRYGFFLSKSIALLFMYTLRMSNWKEKDIDAFKRRTVVILLFIMFEKSTIYTYFIIFMYL